MNNTEYRLSDEVIAQIAKLVQMAILTGTDIVDNLRMLRMSIDNTDSSVLNLSDAYRKISEDQISKMMNEVETMMNDDDSDTQLLEDN